MPLKKAIQVHVGPEDYGYADRFNQLFVDEPVANQCVEMLSRLYAPEDIHVSEVPIYDALPRFYTYMATVPFVTPTDVSVCVVRPTLNGRPFQDVFERKATHIACALGWGASEEEALAAAYSLYEHACVLGMVAAFRERKRQEKLLDEQVWARAREQSKVMLNPSTGEESIDPSVYAALYDIVNKERSLT